MWFVILAAPHLTEKPQDVQKTIDDTLVWECKASAKPKPSYRWLKNGEPLDPMEVWHLETKKKAPLLMLFPGIQSYEAV